MSTRLITRGKPASGSWTTFIERRKTLGMSQIEAARALGKSQTTISQWERGVRAPEIEDFPELALFMDITVNEVFGDLCKIFLPACS